MGLGKDYLTMSLIIFFWLLLGSLNPVSCTVITEPTAIATSKSPLTLKQIGNEFESVLNSVTKNAMAVFIRNSDITLSPSCSNTLMRLFMDLRNSKLPAIKMLDAMAKINPGLLHGSLSIMGDFDMCMEVRATKTGEVAYTKEEESYHGQYCNVEILLPNDLIAEYSKNPNISAVGKTGAVFSEMKMPEFALEELKFVYGVCLPSTCTEADLQEILTVPPLSSFETRVGRCVDAEKKSLEVDQVIFLTILVFLAVVAASGTLLDALLKAKDPKFDGEHKDKFFRFLLAFSVYRNTRKLMSTKKSEGEIEVMNGLYVISSLLVILYHIYFQPFMVYYSGSLYNLRTYMDSFPFSALSTMGLCIDAFFVYSGMFLVYPVFKNGRKPATVNVLKIIIQRYIKLAPPFLMTLGIIMLVPVWGTGPVFNEVYGVAADNARKWWWKFVLMHNNFLSVKEQTFFFMWFVACLMQITIIGAFLLWMMAKNAKLGITATIITGLACNITLGVLTVLRNFPLTYAIYFNKMRENHEVTIQTSPISHVFSYGIGMLLGYYMARGPKLHLSKLQAACGWILCLVFTIGNQWVVYAGRNGSNTILTALYAATHRTAFSIGIAWIIVACTYGYGGILNKFLCWKAFRPFSKMTYPIYLLHYIFLAHHMGVVRMPLSFTHYEIWIRYWGYTVISYGASYIMYVTFVLPLTTIESFFFSRRAKLEVHDNCVQNGNLNDIFVVRNADLVAEDILKPHNKDNNLDNSYDAKAAEQSKM